MSSERPKSDTLILPSESSLHIFYQEILKKAEKKNYGGMLVISYSYTLLGDLISF